MSFVLFLLAVEAALVAAATGVDFSEALLKIEREIEKRIKPTRESVYIHKMHGEYDNVRYTSDG